MRRFPSSTGALVVLCASIALSACAGDASKPVALQTYEPSDSAAVRLADISAETKPGVTLSDGDATRMLRLIRTEITDQNPNAFALDGGRRLKMKIVFTQYDEGNRFARFMLAGLGQIRIDGEVVLSDAQTGETLGRYEVSKQFAFGSIYGASTSIEDVEKGFAKSVADIFKKKT